MDLAVEKKGSIMKGYTSINKSLKNIFKRKIDQLNSMSEEENKELESVKE